jgi:hypothetical protein
LKDGRIVKHVLDEILPTVPSSHIYGIRRAANALPKLWLVGTSCTPDAK